jgi:hypothetical protein
MAFPKRSAELALLIALAAAMPVFADTYHSADFSGQLGSSPNVQAPFSSVLNANAAVSGDFVYDDDLIPATGLANVFFSSFPDIAGIPNATAFDFNLGGGLNFDLGDAQFGEAAIQYNNGQFNGFFFISDFIFENNPYELQVQGGVFGIVAIQGGFPTFNNLVSGTLNIGNGNLTGVSVFTPSVLPPPPPTVPEPASVMLLGAALLGAAMFSKSSKANRA